MKKTLCLVLALAMVFSMAGCGEAKKDDSKIEKSLSGKLDKLNDKLEKETEGPEIAEPTEIPAPAEVEEEIVDTKTPIQKFWGGDWYGIMWITNSGGNYEHLVELTNKADYSMGFYSYAEPNSNNETGEVLENIPYNL